jgi:hypothetical protein
VLFSVLFDNELMAPFADFDQDFVGTLLDARAVLIVPDERLQSPVQEGHAGLSKT